MVWGKRRYISVCQYLYDYLHAWNFFRSFVNGDELFYYGTGISGAWNADDTDRSNRKYRAWSGIYFRTWNGYCGGGSGYGDCTDVIMHLCSLYIEEKEDAYSADAGEAWAGDWKTNREDWFLSVFDSGIRQCDHHCAECCFAVLRRSRLRGYVDHGGYDRAKLYAFDHGADAWRDRRVAAAY